MSDQEQEQQMSGNNPEAMMPLMECPKCGWCHFGVTEAYVRNWEIEWKEFWPTLDESGRDAYGVPNGPPTRDGYEQCFRCGNKDRSGFFKSTKSLYGHTIQPIQLTKQQEIDILGKYSVSGE